jgi:GNAT superfamily N-acetyltransferase
MVSIVKTNSANPHFQQLVAELDAYLAILDGEEHAFYNQLNKIDSIKHTVVAYENNVPVGCGSIREYALDIMEVKRMYVLPAKRNKGIAKNILTALEAWAKDLGYKKCILETGNRQPEAVALYKKAGYNIIPNYGKYLHIENSICFEKILC